MRVQDHILNIMEELVRLYDSEEENPSSDTLLTSAGGQPGSNYTSVIKFSGRPILPPLMTPHRRDEMCTYRRQAIELEAVLRARVRQKLLAKVQAVMKDIEERNAPSRAESSLSPSATSSTQAGPQTLEESSQHGSPRQADSQQHLGDEALQAEFNVQSPRTNTKDSGVYSKGPVAVNDEAALSTGESQEPEHLVDDDKLDTMAYITDISTEEEGDHRMPGAEDEDVSDSSETTTIEHVQQTVAEDDNDTENILSQESQPSEGDNEVFIETATENHHIERETEETDNLKQTADLSESHDCKSEPVPNILEQTEDKARTDQPVADSQTQAQSFGTRERVDHLVRQLNSVLSQNMLTMTQQSIPSTSSSATTLSSEEMNRTVIANEQASTRSQLTSDDIPVDGDNSTTDTESTATASDGDLSAIQDVPEVVDPREAASDRGARSRVASDELECTPDILRSSLLSKVVLDTSEGTSDELSELETGRHSHSNHQLLEDVAPDTSASYTPDISNITPPAKIEPFGDQLSSAKTLTPPSQVTESQSNKLEPSESSPSSYTVTSVNDSHKTISPTPKSTASAMDPFLKSSDISQMYTESTELAPYMNTSSNTIDDAVLTLPYHEEKSAGKLYTEASTSQIATSMAPSQDKLDPGGNQPSRPFQVTGSSSKQRHVRTSSYTLEHPSPVLVAAHEKSRGPKYDDISSPSEITSSSKSSAKHTNIGSQNGIPSGKLTSSMEDLKLKPVHRKLEYNEQPKPILKKTSKAAPPTATEMSPQVVMKPANKTSPPALPSSVSDEAGKEEHLHRYLEHLSQMPVYHPQDSSPQSPLGRTNHGLSPHQEDFQPRTTQHPYSADPSLAASHGAEAQPGIGGSSLEETLQLQMHYFETLKQQMMQQQQQQIAALLAEQERQQLMLQEEFIQQQRSITLHSSGPQHSAPQHPQHPPHPSYITAHAAALPSHDPQARHTAIDGSMLYEPYDRPYSAPTPRVSFAVGPETGSSRRSPAGVYCNQNFPISPNTSGVDAGLDSSQVHIQENGKGLYRSPAVLRQRSASGNQDESFINESLTSSSVQAGRPRVQKKPAFHEHSPPSSSQVTYLQDLRHQDLPPKLQLGLEKMSAAAKGFLTRKLLKTEKVQQIIKTIKDTAEFALSFQQDNYSSKGGISTLQDKNLLDRVLAQLTAAMYEVHEVFFELTTRERMELIRQSRLLEHEKLFKLKTHETSQKSRRISAATRKALDRKKKAKAAEAIVFGQARPKSCPPNTSSPKASRTADLSGPIRRNYQFLMLRALKPVQTTLSPIKPDRISASSLLNSSGRRTPSSPRKTGMAAVKRIQSKARPASDASKHLVRKPNMVPASRKTAVKSVSPGEREVMTRHKRQSPRTDENSRSQMQPTNTRPLSNHKQQSPRDINSNPVPKRTTSQGFVPQHKSDKDSPGLTARPVSQGSNPRPRSQVSNHSNVAGSQPAVTKKTNQPKLVRHTSHTKHAVSSNIRSNGVPSVGGTRPLS